MSSPIAMYLCTKAHIVNPFNFPTKSDVNVDSPSHNLNVMMTQPTNVQQVLDLRPLKLHLPNDTTKRG
jgi:hypothetical protein